MSEQEVIDTTERSIHKPLECVTCPVSNNGFPCNELVKFIMPNLVQIGVDTTSDRRSDSEIASDFKRDSVLVNDATRICNNTLGQHTDQFKPGKARFVPIGGVLINY